MINEVLLKQNTHYTLKLKKFYQSQSVSFDIRDKYGVHHSLTTIMQGGEVLRISPEEDKTITIRFFDKQKFILEEGNTPTDWKKSEADLL